MALKTTIAACIAAFALSIGSSAFAQDATTGGTGNTGNQDNNPAAMQQDTTGTTAPAGSTTGGTGQTGNPDNDPAAIQNCPSGKTAMKNAAGQMTCQ
jgi:hypothetical protein